MVSSPAIEVVSLRMHEGDRIFVRLANLSGCAHVRLLQGDFIGCAFKDNASIPHLFNWRTNDVYALADHTDVYVSNNP